MKKLASLLCAVLLVLSAAAQSTNVDTVVITSTGAGTGTECSNIAYEIQSGGVSVSCSKGANRSDYFGCNAGETFMITADRPIKAIVINGYIKKGYSATVSAGSISYADASEDAVEANPVVVIVDIDSAALQIQNAKQLRCYTMEVYFAANPDVEIGVEEENVYSYEWEPMDSTSFELSFLPEELVSLDMTENLGYACSSLYWENEEVAVELTFFAELTENQLPADGTYEINDTYLSNTVMASPGGDEYYDYPSYLQTDFTEDENGDVWYNPYYIISGNVQITTDSEQGVTLLTMTASTYYGSTINLTYTTVETTAVEKMVVTPSATKYIHNGQVLIHRAGQLFDLLGRKQ